MHFFHSIWKNLHLTENFYTGTACGACDKYEVCVWTVTSLLDLQVIVGDFWQQNSGQRIISPSVGKVALAFVATIEAALAKAADALLKSLALLKEQPTGKFCNFVNLSGTPLLTR